MATRGPGAQRLAIASTALAATLLLGAGVVAADARPDGPGPGDARQSDEVEGVGLASGSRAVGDTAGSFPSVSGDGRIVVFEGAPPDPDDLRESTVYVADRETGETTEITPVPADLRPGNSRGPVVSGDGCVALVVTEMSLDVFRDDDTGVRWDVYRAALPHCGGTIGDWELISTRPGSGGIARDDVVVAPATVDRSATLIAYTHPADHLYEVDGITAVSLVDLAVPVDDVRRTRLVVGTPMDTPDTVFVHGGIDQPALSADGTHLVYRSDATSAEAVPGWGEGTAPGGPAARQIYSWTIAEADPFLAVDLISARPDRSPAPAGASDPDVSRDGTSIVFTSADPGLVPAEYPTCTDACPSQVFLVDRDRDGDGLVDANDDTDLDGASGGASDTPPVTRLVSAVAESDPPVAGTAPSSQPAVSGDGQVVAFVSTAPNLQLIETPGTGGGDDGEILLAELDRGGLTRMTTAADGVVPTPGVHAHPDVGDTGRTTVYDTAAAAALVADDEAANEAAPNDDAADDGAANGTAGGRRIVATSSPPELSLAEANLGTTLVGLQSDEWYVGVINDGPATFHPAEVTIDDDQFAIVAEKSTCQFGAAVPAGGSCTVAMTFTPLRPGPSSATLTVAEAGYGAVSVSTTISGSGGAPALIIKPDGIDFPAVEVGGLGPEIQVDVSNVSAAPTAVASFEITGENADDFVVYTNSCKDRPINPGAACNVGVVFFPSEAGRRTALLEITTTEGAVTTAIVAGDGTYSPVVELDVGEIEAGRDLLATGRRYPANSEVTVVFGDDPGDTVTAVTDAEGSFAVPVPVAPTEREGDRRVVVQTTTGAAASAPVVVISTDQQYVGLPGMGLG